MQPIMFKCSQCNYKTTEALSQRCPECEGVLEPIYPLKDKRRALQKLVRAEGNSIWAFQELLPVENEAHVVTLGEGMTPLVSVPRLAKQIGIDRLWLKLEVVNPTGSFKDRGLSVAISYAVEHQAKGVLGASSGNALHAQATYAAYAGLPSVALVPESMPETRLAQPITCGTKIARVRGDYSQCHRLASSLAKEVGWYNVSTTYENPIIPEGYKTIAYEIWKKLRMVPDWIIIPVGAGPLLSSCTRGFFELYEMGLINKVPRMLGVQARGCAPIARSFEEEREVVAAWEHPIDTVARGIADPLRGYAQDGTYTLKWVRRSNGTMVKVDDTAIMEAVDNLGRASGVYVEPTAAAAIAGLKAAVDHGDVTSDATVVCLLTGTGFKEVKAFAEGGVQPKVFSPHKIDVIKEQLFLVGDE